MIKIKLCLCFLFTLILIDSSSATTYYISNSGNDNNNGLSPVFPWKTIAKLNTEMKILKPGDAVLFERGGYFLGQINLSASGDASNPLIFGAFGEGKNPVISGSILIQNWTPYKNGIYKAEVTANVKNLFLNGEQMILARYPNSGFLTIDQPFPDPKKGFTDKELNQSAGYWTGSVARIRTVNWAYEYSSVKDFSNGSILFSTPTAYPVQPGWGYYLDNNLKVLDTESEWFFLGNKKIGGSVYFYPSENINLGTSFVEGSIFNFGFYSTKNLNNIIIQNLNIRHQYSTGIYFTGINSGIKVENCTFTSQFQCGVGVTGKSNNIEIDNCRFYNINGKGIYLLTCRENIISNNILRNIGMIPGYGTTGDAVPMTAIVVLRSDSTHIFNNNIENVGHDGIDCLGTGNVIEKNVISNSMLYVNDGAAIKSYGQNTKNSTWRNNFIFNVYGNLDGTLKRNNKISASGIYLDEYCNNMSILNNTILNCELAGINLYNGGRNNLFEGNISYGNTVGIRFFQEEYPMTGNIVTDNIFLGLAQNQVAVRLKSRTTHFFPGRFEKNYYVNYSKDGLFQYEIGNNITEYNFPQWQKITGINGDLNSVILSGNEIKYSKIFLNMSDDSLTLLLNSGILYKDINLNSVYGSVVLQPWTSQILFADSDISNMPEINIAGGSINFGNIGETSKFIPEWFNIKANNLSSSLMLEAPEGFEMSLLDDTGFSNTLTIATENGKIDKIIFVRFVPSGDSGYYDFIRINSDALVSKVKVIGNER